MSFEDFQKYFLGGAVQKPFIKTNSPHLIKDIEEKKTNERISQFHNQKSNKTFENIQSGLHTITKSDVIRVAKKNSVVMEKENAIQSINIISRENPLEQDVTHSFE